MTTFSIRQLYIFFVAEYSQFDQIGLVWTQGKWSNSFDCSDIMQFHGCQQMTHLHADPHLQVCACDWQTSFQPMETLNELSQFGQLCLTACQFWHIYTVQWAHTNFMQMFWSNVGHIVLTAIFFIVSKTLSIYLRSLLLQDIFKCCEWYIADDTDHWKLNPCRGFAAARRILCLSL